MALYSKSSFKHISMQNIHHRTSSHPFPGPVSPRNSLQATHGHLQAHQPFTHSRHSNQLMNQTTSPRNSKQKIRLVSPNRTTKASPQPKQNHPPSHSPRPYLDLNPTSHRKQPSNIELGGSGKSRDSRSPHKFQPYHPTPTPHASLQSSDVKKVLVNSRSGQFNGHSFPTKVVFASQMRPSVQNPIDLSSIKAQIVYVEPIKKSAQQVKGSRQSTNRWPTDVAIQEEEPMEELMESYKQDKQLSEIKQLQSQIEQNNLQIKELMKSSGSIRQTSNEHQPTHSEVSNHAASHLDLDNSIEVPETGRQMMKSARASPAARSPVKEPAVQSHQTLINELNFATTKRLDSKAMLAKVEENTEEASVQTDKIEEEPLPTASNCSWRSQQLQIVPNQQCQVMIMTARDPTQYHRETSQRYKHKEESAEQAEELAQRMSLTSLDYTKQVTPEQFEAPNQTRLSRQGYISEQQISAHSSPRSSKVSNEEQTQSKQKVSSRMSVNKSLQQQNQSSQTVNSHKSAKSGSSAQVSQAASAKPSRSSINSRKYVEECEKKSVVSKNEVSLSLQSMPTSQQKMVDISQKSVGDCSRNSIQKPASKASIPPPSNRSIQSSKHSRSKQSIVSRGSSSYNVNVCLKASRVDSNYTTPPPSQADISFQEETCENHIIDTSAAPSDAVLTETLLRETEQTPIRIQSQDRLSQVSSAKSVPKEPAVVSKPVEQTGEKPKTAFSRKESQLGQSSKAGGKTRISNKLYL